MIVLFLIFAMISQLNAITPVRSGYKSEEDIAPEFENIFENAQDQQFRVFKTTPNTVDLKDGEMVIYSSGTTNLMLRVGTTVYMVKISSF